MERGDIVGRTGRLVVIEGLGARRLEGLRGWNASGMVCDVAREISLLGT
jgi:hypothetical protein